VDKLFGAEFTAALATQPVGSWSGPIRSPYGLHLVFVHAATTARPPALEDVRAQVERRFVAEQRAERVAMLLTELRAAYEIRVEDDLDDGADA
jgi:parvulin-like peptidyl-prolyl isomerase